jgi:hypothetical protein
MPATISPSTVYTLTVTVDNPNGLGVFGGFQMVVLNSGNTNAGSLANASSSSVVTPSGGREYHEHNPAQSFGAGTDVTYMVDWTSPVGPDMEMITAYAAGNVANGNGSNTGDLIVTTNVSGTISGTAVEVVVETTDVSCFGSFDGTANANITGGTPGYTYAWNNGASTQVISDLGPGMYCVTVTDSDGNTAEACGDVVEPSEVIGQITSSSNPSCQGSADGTISAAASGGNPGYTFMWSNGDAGATISGLAAGSYTVTVTDASGCTDMLTEILTDPSALTISLVDLANPACFGESSGSIVVEASGGTGAISYVWSTGATGSSLSNVPSGTYSVTAEDANGCTIEEIYALVDPEELVIQLDLLVDVTCNGGSDGSIAVSTPGNNSTFSWSNGATGAQIVNLSAGSYVVTATNDAGCTAEVVYIITAPVAMLVSLVGSENLPCFGDSTGTLTAVVTGGQPPYTYSWSNGSTSDAISSLPAGIYSMTVTDQSACTATAMIEISQPDMLMANVTSTHETSAGANDGTAISNPSGGTPVYSYVWSNGATTKMISNLPPGEYTVTVTDMNGCTSTQTVTVNAFGCNLSADISTSDVSCNGVADGFAEVTFSGAVGSVSILWSNGSTEQSISDLAAGSYAVTVTDSAGCVASVVGVVNEPSALTTSCTVMQLSGPDADDGQIACKVSGGTPPYTMPGQTISADSFQMTGLAPGDYQLLITDANGCLLVEFITISAFGCPTIDSVEVLNLTCNGDNSGIALVEYSGAQSTVTVDWSNGFTGNPATMLAAGSYTVTISDTSGCSAVANFTVTEPEAITLIIDTVIHESGGGDNGAIEISVSGGTSPYTYDWKLNGNTISTEQNPIGLAMGNYIANVTDANGCVFISDSILVEGTTGLNSPELNFNIRVIPNPIHDIATLYWETGVAIHDIEIWSVHGSKMQKIKMGNSETGQYGLNIADFPQGIYYVVATSSDGKGIFKLVKI